MSDIFEFWGLKQKHFQIREKVEENVKKRKFSPTKILMIGLGLDLFSLTAVEYYLLDLKCKPILGFKMKFLLHSNF